MGQVCTRACTIDECKARANAFSADLCGLAPGPSSTSASSHTSAAWDRNRKLSTSRESWTPQTLPEPRYDRYGLEQPQTQHAATEPRLSRAAEWVEGAQGAHSLQPWGLRELAEPSGQAMGQAVGALLNQNYFEQDLGELLSLPASGRTDLEEERPTYRFGNGGTYTGQWFGNTRHGLGTQRWPDGSIYQGEWRANKAEGVGRFVHSDGDEYCGQWQDNVAQGKGIYRHRTDRREVTYYAGEFQNDLQHGHGVETWEEGYRFEGEFRFGQKDGVGVYTWMDGSLYQGCWSKNSINGPGLYIGVDKRQFRGQWRASMIHGVGNYSWPDGREYCGQYEDDRKSGFGCFAWSDRRRYEGYWQDGRQHGKGRYYHHDGTSALALWSRGKRLEWLDDPEAELESNPH